MIQIKNNLNLKRTPNRIYAQYNYTFKPFCGFMRKFLLRSSNMMVFLLVYSSNFPHITPSGLVYKENES